MTINAERIFVEHDAKALTSMLGIEQIGCDGVIIKLGSPGEVLASSIRANPLGEQWLLDVESPGDRVVSWSGTLGDDLFDSHPATWLGPGHTALAKFCDELTPQLERHGKVICFQPHARHVLNDPHSSTTFLEHREGQPFEIALAPMALLEATMLDTIAEHLERTFERLGGVCSLLMLSDVQQDDEHLKAVPLGQGIVPREFLLGLIDRYVPAETPIVLQPGELDSQLRWLSAADVTAAEER